MDDLREKKSRFNFCNNLNSQVKPSGKGKGVMCTHCGTIFLREKHWKAHIKSNEIKQNRPKAIRAKKETKELERLIYSKKRACKTHFKKRAAERLGIQITELDYISIRESCRKATYDLLRGLDRKGREVRIAEMYGMKFEVVYDRYIEELVTVFRIDTNLD